MSNWDAVIKANKVIQAMPKWWRLTDRKYKQLERRLSRFFVTCR